METPFPFKLGAVEVIGYTEIVDPLWGYMTWNSDTPTPGVIEHGGNFLHGTEYRRPAMGGGAWVAYNPDGTERVHSAPTFGPCKPADLHPRPVDIAIMADTLQMGRIPIFLDSRPHDPTHEICQSHGECRWRNKSGTAPNTSLVLNAEELAFIEERFGGSKSAAIHAALAALKRSE